MKLREIYKLNTILIFNIVKKYYQSNKTTKPIMLKPSLV